MLPVGADLANERGVEGGEAFALEHANDAEAAAPGGIEQKAESTASARRPRLRRGHEEGGAKGGDLLDGPDEKRRGFAGGEVGGRGGAGDGGGGHRATGSEGGEGGQNRPAEAGKLGLNRGRRRFGFGPPWKVRWIV